MDIQILIMFCTLMSAQYIRAGCFMITLVARKFHPQMNIVVMMLDVILPLCRIVAIGAEM